MSTAQKEKTTDKYLTEVCKGLNETENDKFT